MSDNGGIYKKLKLINQFKIRKQTMTRNSTEYYRENRQLKKTVYKCPHCDYKSYNSRMCLINHINAKHINECDKPFQCRFCDRGFSQKAHLCVHCEKEHDVILNEDRIVSIAYIIKPTTQEPKSKKTKARRLYYKNNDVIKTTDLNNKKHEYLPDVFMKQHDIHYDARKGFITLHKCPLWKKK